jgi:hypothetical protein
MPLPPPFAGGKQGGKVVLWVTVQGELTGVRGLARELWEDYWEKISFKPFWIS